MAYSHEVLVEFCTLARLIASDDEKNLALALQIQRGVRNPILDKLFQDISRAVVINDTMRDVGINETNIYKAIRNNEHTMLQYCLGDNSHNLGLVMVLYYHFIPDNMVYLLKGNSKANITIFSKFEQFHSHKLREERKLDIEVYIGNNNFSEECERDVAHLHKLIISDSFGISISSIRAKNVIRTSFVEYFEKSNPHIKNSYFELSKIEHIKTDITIFNGKVFVDSYLAINDQYFPLSLMHNIYKIRGNGTPLSNAWLETAIF